MRTLFTAVLVLVAAATVCGIECVEPVGGATVSQLRPTQAKFVRESMEEREKYFDDGPNAKALKADRSAPLPVKFAWSGGKAPFRLTVRRMPDGKVFHDSTLAAPSNAVDSLEIAREWEWSVLDGKGTSARGRFRTEDRAPRLVRIDGVPNARDVGGWTMPDGRRIRQGLLYRTSGLNDNDPVEY